MVTLSGAPGTKPIINGANGCTKRIPKVSVAAGPPPGLTPET